MSFNHQDTWENYCPKLIPTPGIGNTHLGVCKVAYSDDMCTVDVDVKSMEDEKVSCNVDIVIIISSLQKNLTVIANCCNSPMLLVKF